MVKNIQLWINCYVDIDKGGCATDSFTTPLDKVFEWKAEECKLPQEMIDKVIAKLNESEEVIRKFLCNVSFDVFVGEATRSSSDPREEIYLGGIELDNNDLCFWLEVFIKD